MDPIHDEFCQVILKAQPQARSSRQASNFSSWDRSTEGPTLLYNQAPLKPCYATDY